MALIPPSSIRRVTGITDIQRNAILHFMQGAIYSRVINNPAPFAVRELVGGENTDWGETPLQALNDKHKDLGKTEEAAFEDAAKDLGWLVKGLLAREKTRTYLRTRIGRVNGYSWIRD